MNFTTKVREAAEERRIKVKDLDTASDQPLVMRLPDTNLLYSLEELAVLLEPLIGIDSPTDSNGRILDVRPKGMWFEAQVAHLLGYNSPPRSGVFPDLRHQLIETKHHVGKSVTIDFGRHHPGSSDLIPGQWNRELGFTERDVRYIIALAPPSKYVLTTLIIQTGEQIVNMFGVPLTQTIKYQMGIPKHWREEHQSSVLVGTTVWRV
jgi:hypothetical protein